MVTVEDDDGDAMVGPSPDILAAMSVEYPGHAVLDSGATESIASLEALEEIMVLRSKRHGHEDVTVHQRQKRFRFGNGTYQQAVSFVEVPQVISGQKVPLGVHALDAPGIPLLISVKTLTKMQAVIDFELARICFKLVAPDLWIPLKRAPNGHLLLDLTKDWVPQKSGESCLTCAAADDSVPSASSQYKGAAAESFDVKFEPISSSLNSSPTFSSPSFAARAVVSSTPSASHGTACQFSCGCFSTTPVDAVHKHDAVRSEENVRHGSEECASTTSANAADSGSNMRVAWPLVIAAATALTSTSSPSPCPSHVQFESSSCAKGCVSTDTACHFRDDHKGDCKDQIKEDTSPNSGKIRFFQEGRSGRQRQPGPGVPMLWQSPSNARREGQPIGPQCPRQMDCLPNMQIEDRIHSQLWCNRSVSPGRALGPRCGSGNVSSEGGGEDKSGCQGKAQCQGSERHWRRGVAEAALAEVGERAHQDHHSEGTSSGQHQCTGSPRCIPSHRPDGRADEDSPRQEGCEERQSEGGRAARSRRLVCLERAGISTTVNDMFHVENAVSEELYAPAYAKLNEEQKAQLEQHGTNFVADLNEAFEEILATSPQVDLMEVCCPPDSTLVETFHERGRSAIRIGLPALDLSTTRGCNELLDMVSRHRPKILWISLPCGPYSPIQTLFNESTEEMKAKSMLRQKKARKLIRNGLRAAYRQIALGGDVGWEWPNNNGGWHVSEMRHFIEYLKELHKFFCAKVHGCSYGLVNTKQEFVKKPWKIVCTNEALANGLTRQCPGDHPHGECLGGHEARASGFYPKAMCLRIFQVVQSMIHGTDYDVFPKVFPVFDDTIMEEPDAKTSSLVPLSDMEKKNVEKTLHKLHRRSGHPSNQALAACLRHRGAHPEVISMASRHQCPECQELRLATNNPVGALQRSEVLWETLVIDNAEFPIDDKVLHCMIMVDEASRLVCPHFLFQHHQSEHRNCSGPEAVQALQDTWVRHYGAPASIRLDPEGAFRSTELMTWASERGIEIFPCAAEAHYQISLVERTIQTVKNTTKQLLQSGECDPWQAIIQACQAHNEMERVHGYTPYQWAFGRQPTLTGKMHDQAFDDPFWTSSMVPGSEMAANLKMRHKAQTAFLKSQAQEHISRAMNAKTRRHQIFLPGDLVYFKRIKPPAQPTAAVRMPHKLWQWYGPGRVLATETRSDALGRERRPSHIIWIVTHGRLKRCAPEQLRHASDREKALAEGADAPTAAWTFHSLTSTLFKGEYEILDDMVLAKGPPRESRRGRSQTPGRSPSPAPTRGVRSRTPAAVTPMPPTSAASSARPAPSTPAPSTPAPDPMQDERTLAELQADLMPKAQKRGPGRPPKVDLQRFIQDPAYNPPPGQPPPPRSTTELFEQPLFKKQRKEHVAVQNFFADDEAAELYMCCMELEVPKTHGEWKKLKRSPQSFYAKKLKGVEVKWHSLSPEEKAGFDKAKQAEVQQWLTAAAVRRAARDQVPQDRLVRMRWVLTYKDTGQPKGRIVLIGFEDPDLEKIQSSSPTMSRRTRQLALQFSSIRRWRTLKADVRAAFLQGESGEATRALFAKPVPELAAAMNLKEDEVVQVLKTAYGLIHAPAAWYQCVKKTLADLNFYQSRSDPCLWLFYTTNSENKKVTSGYICSHVDDFIISGDEECDEWIDALNSFYAKFRWSPWECSSFLHCGVRVREEPDFSFTLDHSSFCESIESITYTTKNDHDPLTPDELTQLRGILGALQWRSQQTAPHLMAKIGQLQSAVTRANLDTLKAANKLARECFQTRYLSTRINQLNVDDPLQVNFVAWADAALANRADLSSTGGYVISATTPDMVKGKRSPLTLISWRSCRLPRKARSSLAAEAQAMAEADQELVFIRLAWAEFCALEIDLKVPESAVSKIPGVVVTDAKALFDILLKRDLNSAGVVLKDKYSALEILCLLESLEKMQTTVRRVHSDAQLADHLTKPLPIGTLHKVMNEGFWTLVYDPDYTSAERLKKAAAKSEDSNKTLRGMSESELVCFESLYFSAMSCRS